MGTAIAQMALVDTGGGRMMRSMLRTAILLAAVLTWIAPAAAQLTADLTITKDDGQPSAVPGTLVSYTITVGNSGPDNVTAATVTDTFPVELSAIAWTCIASAGSTCTA